MFKGRAALVTGGGSGIGAAASMRLAAEGASVAVVDLRGDAAARTVELIAKAGGVARAITADIAEEAANTRMFDQAEAAFGPLDVAFLNAGALQPYGPLEDMEVSAFDRMLAINLRGPFLGVRQAQRRLKRGGACVVTASAGGLTGFADAVGYSAAKHGVVGLIRSCARDFAKRGLRINAICPGMVNTPMIGAPPVEGIEPVETLANAEYRGGLSPQQVAEVVLFLLGQGASGVNGQAQLVDAALLSAFPPLAE